MENTYVMNLDGMGWHKDELNWKDEDGDEFNEDEKTMIREAEEAYMEETKRIDEAVKTIVKILIGDMDEKEGEWKCLEGPQPGDSSEERRRKHKARLAVLEKVRIHDLHEIELHLESHTNTHNIHYIKNTGEKA